jgi:hypothetical protein
MSKKEISKSQQLPAPAQSSIQVCLATASEFLKIERRIFEILISGEKTKYIYGGSHGGEHWALWWNHMGLA